MGTKIKKFWDVIAELSGKPIKGGIAETKVGKLFTRKELGNYPSLNMKLTDPMATGEYGVNLVGRDGRLYALKQWLEMIERDLKKSANAVMDKNYLVSTRLKNNLEYNVSIRNKARQEVERLEKAFVDEGRSIDDVLKSGEQTVQRGDVGISGIRGDVEGLTESARDIQRHLEKIRKAAEDLKKSTSPEVNFSNMMRGIMEEQRAMARLNHEAYYRSMVQPFLLDAHKKGLIKLHPDTIESFKIGGHHKFNDLKYPDPVDVYKYHFGDKSLKKIAAGNTDVSNSGILEWIEKTGTPQVVKKEGFEHQGKYLSRAEIEDRMKESVDRYNWAKNKEKNTAYANISDAERKAHMIKEDKKFGKYEQLHDQLEIPERAGKNVTEGLGQPNAVYKTYDDKGVIKSLIKRITDPETNLSRQIQFDAQTGRALKEDLAYATVRDLTKPEKVYKPEELQKMKNELLKTESIQPPFKSQYEKRLLDELGGEQLEQLIKREKDFKKTRTAADEADLAIRKQSHKQQTLLKNVEDLIKGTDASIYTMKGKLTKQGMENTHKAIEKIDGVLNELLHGDSFRFLGKERENLILRLQDKSVDLQDLLKKGRYQYNGSIPKETVDLKPVRKSTADEKHRAKIRAVLMELPDFKKTSLTTEDMDFILKDITAADSAEVALAKAKKRATKVDRKKRQEDLIKLREKIVDEKKEAKDFSEAMVEAMKDVPERGTTEDLIKFTGKKIKKDPLGIRLMKNKSFDMETLATEGYNLEEINKLQLAKKSQTYIHGKGDVIHPDELFSQLEDINIDEDIFKMKIEDFNPEDYFAKGGRVGFKKGGIANRNMLATLFE